MAASVDTNGSYYKLNRLAGSAAIFSFQHWWISPISNGMQKVRLLAIIQYPRVTLATIRNHKQRKTFNQEETRNENKVRVEIGSGWSESDYTDSTQRKTFNQ
jgi:hypothetical protein